MKRTAILVGQEYAYGPSPEWETDYRTERVEVVSVDKWEDPDWSMSRTPFDLDGTTFQVSGRRASDGRGVLVKQTYPNGKVSLKVVPTAHLRATWAEGVKAIRAARESQQRIEATRQAERDATSARVAKVREALAERLGRPSYASASRFGEVSLPLRDLEALLGLSE